MIIGAKVGNENGLAAEIGQQRFGAGQVVHLAGCDGPARAFGDKVDEMARFELLALG
jgi:hypothetical protein